MLTLDNLDLNKPSAVNICGIKVDCYSFDEVIERIIVRCQSRGKPEYVVTPNAQHILLLQSDAQFRQVYRQAFLSVPDGVSLLWAAQFLKTPLKGRVNGTDLFEKFCAIAARQNLKIFLLGGRPGSVEKTQEILTTRHPTIDIVGIDCPPYGFESDPTILASIATKIKAAAPDILFVGLGTPKQERWIHANYQKLGVPISIGIGGSFEMVSGMVARAPVWMQKAGLEWFFRLLIEPRRLWKRYIIGNPQFIWLVCQQKLGAFKTYIN